MAARILVVDDEATIGRVMRRVLYGYEVTAVTSALDGLERVERGEHFDAVLCDVHMPEMNGLEFASRLATVAPALADHLLFVTADRRVTERTSGRPVQTMPFEPFMLRASVEQLLRPTPSRHLAVTAPPAAGTSANDVDEELATEGARALNLSQRPTVRPPRNGGGSNDY